MDAMVANSPFITPERLLKTDRADPAGESLDASGAIDALIRMSEGTRETEVAGRVVPAKTPDWPMVEERARELLDRSVDIRLLIVLATAVLRTRDVNAFVDCLRSIAALVRDHWEAWYPRTLEKGSLDLEERQSAIAELKSSQIVSGLRALRPFAAPSLRSMGVSSLQANGNGTPPDLRSLETALADPAAQDDAARVRQALLACVQALTQMTEALEARSVLVDLSNLSTPLSEAAATLGKVIVIARGQASAEDALSGSAAGEQVMTTGAPGATGAGAFSRESAKQVLQQMIDHFVRVEPSSPVPLYLKRAQTLIGLEFSDVVREMGDDVGKFSKT